MGETRKLVLNKSRVIYRKSIFDVNPSRLPMESSRDNGDDTRVGYDIDTIFGAAIAFDVRKLRLRERIVRTSLLAGLEAEFEAINLTRWNDSICDGA